MSLGLYDRARQLYGRRTADRLCDFFNDMQLPLPSEREFTETEDKGFIVFLNKPGIVIRFTNKWSGLWNESKRVLHPLGSCITGRLRADINPGITCPMTEQQRDELTEGLHAEKLDLHDPGLYNGGTLPAVANLIKEGYAVAVDPVAVSDLSSAVTQIGKLLRQAFGHFVPPATDDPQTKLYGPLRDIFNAAWKHGDHPDAGLIKTFWQECRNMKAEKLLAASWLTSEMASRNYKNAYEGSMLYQRHCREMS